MKDVLKLTENDHRCIFQALFLGSDLQLLYWEFTQAPKQQWCILVRARLNFREA